MLASELQRLGIPYVMTRSSDETRSLTSRRDLAARYPGSVFVSIPYNAAQNTAARGMERLSTTVPAAGLWGLRSNVPSFT